MSFAGWPKAAAGWFEGLEADNSKPYFEARRATYEDAVRGPLLALLDEVEAEFGEGKVFRPNRDVRFSADKSPYKTNAAALIGAAPASYYVSVSADGVMAGSGMYHMAPDQLTRYRTAAADGRKGGQLARVVEGIGRAGYDIAGEQLKTAPRGVDPNHPRILLLRHKGLVAMAEWPWDRTSRGAAALERVQSMWRTTTPLVDWLNTHVGAAEDPPVRGRRR